MPAISVIVPIYKVEQYLRRCVDSILGQSYKDFELILVDDGSPDNCGLICDEYARKDARVVVIHQENGGLSAARNAGIDWAFANSNSRWLFFVDSDDFIHPESLERLLNAALELKVDISIGGFANTTGKLPEAEKENLAPELWKSRDYFLQKNVNAVVAWGKIYRKELFREIRYPVGKIHEDEYTTYKMLFMCENIAVISAPLYGYFVNQTGIMRSAWSPKRLDVHEAFFERIEFFKRMGDRDLERDTIRRLAANAAVQFGMAGEYPRYRRKIRATLRRILRRYKEGFSFMEDDWLYDVAYPRLSHRIRAIVLRGKRNH